MAAAPCPPWMLLGHPHNHRAGSARLPWQRCEVGSQEASSSKVSRGQNQGGRGTDGHCGPAASEVVGLGQTSEPLCPAVVGVGCQHPDSPGHPLAGMEEVLPAGPQQNNAPCVQPQRAPATLPTGRKRRRGHGLRGAPTPHHPPPSGTAPPRNRAGPLLAQPQGAAKGQRGLLTPSLVQSQGARGVSPSQRGLPGGHDHRPQLQQRRAGDNPPMANGWESPSSGTTAQARLARGLLGGMAPKGAG